MRYEAKKVERRLRRFGKDRFSEDISAAEAEGHHLKRRSVTLELIAGFDDPMTVPLFFAHVRSSLRCDLGGVRATIELELQGLDDERLAALEALANASWSIETRLPAKSQPHWLSGRSQIVTLPAVANTEEIFPPIERCGSCGEHTELVGEIIVEGTHPLCKFCANDLYAHDLLADEVVALCLRWTDACIARDVRLDMVLEAFDRGRIRVEDMIKERYDSQTKAGSRFA